MSEPDRRNRLRYVERPVTIEYTAYSLAKGQNMRDAVAHPARSVCAKALPMIAQLILSSCWPQFCCTPGPSTAIACGGTSGPAGRNGGALLRLVSQHSTQLAELVGVGRGVDLILYTWVCLSLIVLLNLHLKLRTQTELITTLARKIAIADAQSNVTPSRDRQVCPRRVGQGRALSRKHALSLPILALAPRIDPGKRAIETLDLIDQDRRPYSRRNAIARWR